MAKELRKLIKGQDIAFDTHQAGDGQEVHVEDLHLEKRLHGGKGKARFPFFGNFKPSVSGKMTEKDLIRVTKEVADALKKDENLTRELAKTIVNVLKRFRGKNTDIREDACEAARKIAGYFGLSDEFLRIVEDYSQNKLIFFMTIHFNPTDGTIHEIVQSANSVEIRKARRNYPLNRLYPHNHN
ncbi:MAG: hypothetical protein WCI06_09270 [Methylococcaceae bacterium]|jgi:hypothetical protein